MMDYNVYNYALSMGRSESEAVRYAEDSWEYQMILKNKHEKAMREEHEAYLRKEHENYLIAEHERKAREGKG